MHCDTDEVIQDIRKRIESCQRHLDLLQRTLLGKGHIIEMPGRLYLHIETEPTDNGRHAVVGHGVTPDPTSASQLTREDAEHLASVTRNGHGDTGWAIHIKDALANTIERDRQTLAFLDETVVLDEHTGGAH